MKYVFGLSLIVSFFTTNSFGAEGSILKLTLEEVIAAKSVHIEPVILNGQHFGVANSAAGIQLEADGICHRLNYDRAMNFQVRSTQELGKKFSVYGTSNYPPFELLHFDVDGDAVGRGMVYFQSVDCTK